MKLDKEQVEEITRFNSALLAFRKAYFELNEAIGSADYDILIKLGFEDKYPLSQSFDEMELVDWIDNLLEKIEDVKL